MKKKYIIIITILSVLILSLVYSSNNVSSETKTQIIKTLNIELNNLPSKTEEILVNKTYFFNNQKYTVKFKSSKTEIENWINRNKKILIQREIVAGVEQFLFIENQHYYFVVIRKNDVEIKL